MPLYIVTVSRNLLNQPLTWQNGEVRKYSDEGELLAVQISEPEVSPASWGGQGAYDPETGLFWYTMFADPYADPGSTYVGSFRANPVSDPARPFVLGPRFNVETTVAFSQVRFDQDKEPYDVPLAQAESLLLGPDGLLYVGFQQRFWGEVGVEDEQWRPMRTFTQDGTPEGVFNDPVRTFGWSQWGHQNLAWLDWGKTIIFTDETRMVKVIDVESGEISLFCDVYGTAPEGFRVRGEIPGASYEDNPRSPTGLAGASYRVAVSHKKGRVYVCIPIFSTSTGLSFIGISVWDFAGNHCVTFRTAGPGTAYGIELSEDDSWLWVMDSLLVSSGSSAGDAAYTPRVYRMDAWSGDGLDEPLLEHVTANGRFSSLMMTERVPWGNIPVEMQGNERSEGVRFEGAE